MRTKVNKNCLFWWYN